MRIINVSSRAHIRYQMDLDNLDLHEGYTPMRAYSQSKLANIYFTEILQKKITEAGINGITISLHPGVIWTDGVR